MKTQRKSPWLGAALVLLLTRPGLGVAATKAAEPREALHLTAGQKEFLWLEPVIASLRLDSERLDRLPAAPGKGKFGTLRFEIQPPLKVRPQARPLPLEAQGAGVRAPRRDYDLSEWFVIPGPGTWTVQAVLEHQGGTLTSKPLTFSVRKPAKGDAEQGPVDRIHHTPWSNYETNAFCGDTFDVVKRWPTSRLARYCHYWNGRHLQHKKEYAQALVSYRTLLSKYPDFVLADAAAYGMVECLVALQRLDEAQKVNRDLLHKGSEREKTGVRGATVVQRLAEEMARRLQRSAR